MNEPGTADIILLAGAKCALTRWQHSSACNYVMAAILNVWRRQKSDSANRCLFTWRTILPNFTAYDL